MAPIDDDETKISGGIVLTVRTAIPIFPSSYIISSVLLPPRANTMAGNLISLETFIFYHFWKIYSRVKNQSFTVHSL